MFTLHTRDATLYGSNRVAAAIRKAERLFPGAIGEVLADQLGAIDSLRSWIGPRSLTVRLLVEIESLPWPDPEIGS